MISMRFLCRCRRRRPGRGWGSPGGIRGGHIWMWSQTKISYSIWGNPPPLPHRKIIFPHRLVKKLIFKGTVKVTLIDRLCKDLNLISIASYKQEMRKVTFAPKPQLKMMLVTFPSVFSWMATYQMCNVPAATSQVCPSCSVRPSACSGRGARPHSPS